MNNEYYQFGDLKIKKQKLHDFLKQLTPRDYYTRELISEYQKVEYQNNQGMPPSESWNANFGKILKQCSLDNDGNKYIKEIKAGASTQYMHGRPTLNSIWEIMNNN